MEPCSCDSQARIAQWLVYSWNSKSELTFDKVLNDVIVSRFLRQITSCVAKFVFDSGVDLDSGDQEHHHINAAMSKEPS